MTLMQSFLGLGEDSLGFFVSAAYSSTIPTHETGDIIISYKPVSSTVSQPAIPTTPSGWTSLQSAQQFVSPINTFYASNLIAIIAPNNSVTGWGDTQLYAVYRNFIGFGNSGILLGTGGPFLGVAFWPAIPSLQNTSGSSVVMGLGHAIEATAPTTPGIGTSRFVSESANYSMRVWDTNTGVSSFSSNINNTRNGINYYCVELLE